MSNQSKQEATAAAIGGVVAPRSFEDALLASASRQVETIATHHPDVAGRCPACGATGTLFLGSGGYVTCSVAECPNPGAAADLLLPAPTTVTQDVVVKEGDLVESRAAGDRCVGPVTTARPDDPYAWMWCRGCKRAHVLQNPLHRFWRLADRED